MRPLFGTPGMKLWLLIALNFGCYGILILLSRSSAFSWLLASQETSTPMVAKLSLGFFSLFTFLIPAMIFANAALPERFDYYKLHRKVNFVPVLITIFAVLASMFFVDVLAKWNSGLITDPEWISAEALSQEHQSWVLQMPGVADLIVCLIASALIPAVTEELFFRGGIQQLLHSWTRNPHLAIFLAALIFSMLHLDVFAFFPRFLMGIMFGYLFWWSGSLRLSIVAHFVFNGFMIVNQYYVEHNPESWWTKLETSYVMGIVSLVITVGALLTCRNLLKRQAADI